MDRHDEANMKTR